MGFINYNTPNGQTHDNKWLGQVGDLAGTLVGAYFGVPFGGKIGGNIGQSFGDLFGGNWTGLGQDFQNGQPSNLLGGGKMGGGGGML